jgi:hypothetical protein
MLRMTAGDAIRRDITGPDETPAQVPLAARGMSGDRVTNTLGIGASADTPGATITCRALFYDATRFLIGSRQFSLTTSAEPNEESATYDARPDAELEIPYGTDTYGVRVLSVTGGKWTISPFDYVNQNPWMPPL